jgi:hypothetical protein
MRGSFALHVPGRQLETESSIGSFKGNTENLKNCVYVGVFSSMRGFRVCLRVAWWEKRSL